MIKPKSAGCPRCRLDLIVFTREVKLPRFTLAAGEEWEMPQARYTSEGAELGGGIIPKDAFEIVEEDHTVGAGQDPSRSAGVQRRCVAPVRSAGA